MPFNVNGLINSCLILLSIAKNISLNEKIFIEI